MTSLQEGLKRYLVSTSICVILFGIYATDVKNLMPITVSQDYNYEKTLRWYFYDCFQKSALNQLERMIKKSKILQLFQHKRG